MSFTKKLDKVANFLRETYEEATDLDEMGRRMAENPQGMGLYDDESMVYFPIDIPEDEGQEE
ncbi:MAG: hypothetical protein ACLFTY_03850 [Candidatus Aenigmatarchaeota archaeon]